MTNSVCIVLPDLRPGGAEKLHVDLAREWARSGIRVEFVLRRARGELLSQLPEGTRVVDLEARRVRNSIWRLVRYFRTADADVAIAAMWPLTFVVPTAAKIAGYKGHVAVSEHTPLGLAYARRGAVFGLGMKLSLHAGYSLATTRICVSGGVAREMSSLSGIAMEKFNVIHNPVTMPVAEADAESPTPEGMYVLAVGSLKRVKRFDLLIEAFSILREKTAIRLKIVGEGPHRSELEARIRALSLSDRVELVGYRSNLNPWYANASLFVLCSDYEGFATVLVEALAHGLPVVSTDCPWGPREVLKGGELGRLVPVDDADSLAQAIHEQISSVVDKEKLRGRAREFAVDKIAAQYLHAFG